MDYIFISETDFQKARRKIRESLASKKTVVFYSKDDEMNRKILEKESPQILMLVLSSRKDKQKQRDSGFNQVLAKIAKKKGISIGINLDELENKNLKEKSEILGRIRQNIKICRKEKVKTVFISKKDKDSRNLKSLALVLGIPTENLKNI